jgi:leader peptidase (prepilin peptidase) / N-methyltransferase
MELDLYYGILVFIFGLVMGSFFNVCICRIPKEESVISPPSHCTACGNQLKFYDMLPVLSFLILKGRCRYCSIKVSTRYALVELLTAAVYTALFQRYSLSIEFLAAAFLMSILIIVFFIDLDYKIIPHGLTLIGLGGGVILVVFKFFNPMPIFGNENWWSHLLGILPGSGILLLVAVLALIIYKSDEGMGMGDVYIFAPIGLFLGWKLCLLNLLISILIAGFCSIVLLIIRKKNRKDAIAFGPFIVTGTFIVLMWGNSFLNWYFNLYL